MKKRAYAKNKTGATPKPDKPKQPYSNSAVPPSAAEILRAAKLYYRDGKTKREIAGAMEIDTRKVALLLKQGVDLGIVSIIFRETRESQLEDQLLYKYPHLHKAFVLPGEKINTRDQPETYRDLLNRWASVAAGYFEEQVDNAAARLALLATGGETILNIFSAIPEKKREKVFIHAVSLVRRGNEVENSTSYDPMLSCGLLWIRCGQLSAHLEYAPTDPAIQARNQPDLIFAGIGVLTDPKDPPPPFSSGLSLPLDKPSYAALRRNGCAGDVACNWIDAKGDAVDGCDLFLTPGYGIDWYKRMAAQGKKVVVAAGPDKIGVLRAALAGKVFNVFLTDAPSAEELIRG